MSDKLLPCPFAVIKILMTLLCCLMNGLFLKKKDTNGALAAGNVLI